MLKGWSPKGWYPCTYEGMIVHHEGCRGTWWEKYDEHGTITDRACDHCRPDFRDEQLELPLNGK